MKRLCCVILLTVMVLSAAGCSTEEILPEASAPSVSVSSETGIETSSADAPQEFVFSLGEWSGDVYTNDCFGIRYVRPDGGRLVHAPNDYALTSEAPPQLADDSYVPDPAQELPDFVCLLCEADPNYDTNNAIGSSHLLTVNAENLSATGNLGISPKEYLEKMMFCDVDMMVLSAALDEETQTEWYDEYIIGGQTYSVFHTDWTYDGGYYEEFWALRPVGEYMVVIFSSRDASDAMSVDDMIACFE